MKVLFAAVLLFSALPAYSAPYTGVFPLVGTSPALPETDLAPLREIIGDAHYVGLGESVHGSGGFLKAKFRLIKYMVEELGFRAIGLESNWLDAQVASDYVQTCAGSPNAAMNGLRDFFQDPNDLEMLKWLCTFNRDHPGDRVVFFGFDMQEPYHQGSALQSFFDGVIPGQAAALMKKLDSCLCIHTRSWDDMLSSQEWKEVKAHGISRGDFESCMSGVQSLLDFTKKNESAFAASSSDARVKEAELALSGLGSWEQMQYDSSLRQLTQAQEARDMAMLYNVQSLESLLFRGKRVILSCHNAHVGAHMDQATGPVVEQGGFAGASNIMGVVLAKELGSDFVPIGLTGFDVHSHWSDAPQVPIPDSPEAIEMKLHALNQPYVLLDTSGSFVDPNQTYLMSIQNGVMGLNLRANFRAILYLDQAPAND